MQGSAGRGGVHVTPELDRATDRHFVRSDCANGTPHAPPGRASKQKTCTKSFKGARSPGPRPRVLPEPLHEDQKAVSVINSRRINFIECGALRALIKSERGVSRPPPA
ncbi:hypothetical protein EVAR_15870_1 [Eumeta japonica]|uniref:Uncharacterized protein n=1 Tax=Eumeta variegata TaxID=151549 RepID=A0A4C1UFH6_EUMVA|nr:hypothetical protein EVAR_15870_1 [Eumeta japonica]